MLYNLVAIILIVLLGLIQVKQLRCGLNEQIERQSQEVAMLRLTLEGKIKVAVEERIRNHLCELVKQNLRDKVRDKVKEEVCGPLFVLADNFLIMLSLQSRFRETCSSRSSTIRGRLSKSGRLFIIRKLISNS